MRGKYSKITNGCRRTPPPHNVTNVTFFNPSLMVPKYFGPFTKASEANILLVTGLFQLNLLITFGALVTKKFPVPVLSPSRAGESLISQLLPNRIKPNFQDILGPTQGQCWWRKILPSLNQNPIFGQESAKNSTNSDLAQIFRVN